MVNVDKTAFLKGLHEAFEKNGLGALLWGERSELFFALTERMLTVNEQFNLTAITEPSRVALLHYADSVKAAESIPQGARVVDVGCGAGFPSLPLAICRPDLEILALDSTAKRVHYVEETAKLLGLENLSTVIGRAEELGKSTAYREKFDCAVARAVAPMPVLCELCLPFVKVGGVFVAMKGKSVNEERADRAIFVLGGRVKHISVNPLVSPSDEEFDRISIVIAKEKKTPPLYPRAYAKIAKSPL